MYSKPRRRRTWESSTPESHRASRSARAALIAVVSAAALTVGLVVAPAASGAVSGQQAAQLPWQQSVSLFGETCDSDAAACATVSTSIQSPDGSFATDAAIAYASAASGATETRSQGEQIALAAHTPLDIAAVGATASEHSSALSCSGDGASTSGATLQLAEAHGQHIGCVLTITATEQEQPTTPEPAEVVTSATPETIAPEPATPASAAPSATEEPAEVVAEPAAASPAPTALPTTNSAARNESLAASSPQTSEATAARGADTADCTGNSCATLRLAATVSGGTLQVSQVLLSAERTNTGDWYHFASAGQTRSVPRSSTYSIVAEAADGSSLDNYEVTLTCVTSHTNVTVDSDAMTVQFPGNNNRTANCTIALTYRSPAQIVVNVGGDRSGTTTVAPLAGVVLQLQRGTDASALTPIADDWATCTSTATGACTFTVPNVQPGGQNNTRLWIAQQSAPAGWAPLGTLATGAGTGADTERPYVFQTPTLSTGGVYRSSNEFMISSSTSNVTASGGIWANRRENVALPQTCGVDVALVVDLSGSLSGQLPQLKAAAKALVDALAGTNSRVGIYTFASNAPAAAGDNLTPTQVSTAAGAQTVRDHIDTFTTPTGGTNWDRGIAQVPAGVFDAAVVLTDGNPTFYSSPEQGPGNFTRFRETENGVASANALKASGTRVIALGVGSGVSGSPRNLQAISGPTVNSDYFQSADFAGAASVLRNFALGSCLGSLTIVKQEVPASNTGENIAGAQPAGGWSFGVTSATQGTTLSSSSVTTEAGTGAGNVGITYVGGVNSASITATETQQPGFTLVTQSGRNATCSGTRTDGTTMPITPTNSGATGFTVTVPANVAVSCTVYNRKPNTAASLIVTKQWVINGVTYTNANQPLAAAGVRAQLTLAGSNANWAEVYTGYQATNTVAIGERPLTIPASLDLCRATGVQVLNSQGTVVASNVPYTATLGAGENRYTVRNVVTCTSELTLVKNVINGPATANEWNLRAHGPSGSLAGPSGTTGANAQVTPGAQYALSESNGPATYLQSVVEGATITAPATGSWACVQIDASGTAFGNFAAGANGTVQVPLGTRVRCTADNETALITLLKVVPSGGLTPDNWDLTATPAAGVADLRATTVVGADTESAANTFAVRPGHDYAITEDFEDFAYLQTAVERWDAERDAWVAVTDPSAISLAPGEHGIFRFVNNAAPTFQMPLTGGTASDWYTISGLIALLGAAAGGVATYIKRRRARAAQ